MLDDLVVYFFYSLSFSPVLFVVLPCVCVWDIFNIRTGEAIYYNHPPGPGFGFNQKEEKRKAVKTLATGPMVTLVRRRESVAFPILTQSRKLGKNCVGLKLTH